MNNLIVNVSVPGALEIWLLVYAGVARFESPLFAMDSAHLVHVGTRTASCSQFVSFWIESAGAALPSVQPDYTTMSVLHDNALAFRHTELGSSIYADATDTSAGWQAWLVQALPNSCFAPIAINSPQTIQGDFMVQTGMTLAVNAPLNVTGAFLLQSGGSIILAGNLFAASVTLQDGSSISSSAGSTFYAAGPLTIGNNVHFTPVLLADPGANLTLLITVAEFASLAGAALVLNPVQTAYTYAQANCTQQIGAPMQSSTVLSLTISFSVSVTCSGSGTGGGGLPTAALIGIIVGGVFLLVAVVISVGALLMRSRRRRLEARLRAAAAATTTTTTIYWPHRGQSIFHSGVFRHPGYAPSICRIAEC